MAKRLEGASYREAYFFASKRCTISKSPYWGE